MTAADVLIHTTPRSPVVDGRVSGSIFHGERPLRVARDQAEPGLGVYAICRACRAAVAVGQPDVATAGDRGRAHLDTVDHSPAAVRR